MNVFSKKVDESESLDSGVVLFEIVAPDRSKSPTRQLGGTLCHIHFSLPGEGGGTVVACIDRLASESCVIGELWQAARKQHEREVLSSEEEGVSGEMFAIDLDLLDASILAQSSSIMSVCDGPEHPPQDPTSLASHASSAGYDAKTRRAMLASTLDPSHFQRLLKLAEDGGSLEAEASQAAAENTDGGESAELELQSLRRLTVEIQLGGSGGKAVDDLRLDFECRCRAVLSKNGVPGKIFDELRSQARKDKHVAPGFETDITTLAGVRRAIEQRPCSSAAVAVNDEGSGGGPIALVFESALPLLLLTQALQAPALARIVVKFIANHRSAVSRAAERILIPPLPSVSAASSFSPSNLGSVRKPQPPPLSCSTSAVTAKKASTMSQELISPPTSPHRSSAHTTSSAVQQPSHVPVERASRGQSSARGQELVEPGNDFSFRPDEQDGHQEPQQDDQRPLAGLRSLEASQILDDTSCATLSPPLPPSCPLPSQQQAKQKTQRNRYMEAELRRLQQFRQRAEAESNRDELLLENAMSRFGFGETTATTMTTTATTANSGASSFRRRVEWEEDEEGDSSPLPLQRPSPMLPQPYPAICANANENAHGVDKSSRQTDCGDVNDGGVAGVMPNRRGIHGWSSMGDLMNDVLGPDCPSLPIYQRLYNEASPSHSPKRSPYRHCCRPQSPPVERGGGASFPSPSPHKVGKTWCDENAVVVQSQSAQQQSRPKTWKQARKDEQCRLGRVRQLKKAKLSALEESAAKIRQQSASRGRVRTRLVERNGGGNENSNSGVAFGVSLSSGHPAGEGEGSAKGMRETGKVERDEKKRRWKANENEPVTTYTAVTHTLEEDKAQEANVAAENARRRALKRVREKRRVSHDNAAQHKLADERETQWQVREQQLAAFIQQKAPETAGGEKYVQERLRLLRPGGGEESFWGDGGAAALRLISPSKITDDNAAALHDLRPQETPRVTFRWDEDYSVDDHFATRFRRDDDGGAGTAVAAAAVAAAAAQQEWDKAVIASNDKDEDGGGGQNQSPSKKQSPQAEGIIRSAAAILEQQQRQIRVLQDPVFHANDDSPASVHTPPRRAAVSERGAAVAATTAGGDISRRDVLAGAINGQRAVDDLRNLLQDIEIERTVHRGGGSSQKKGAPSALSPIAASMAAIAAAAATPSGDAAAAGMLRSPFPRGNQPVFADDDETNDGSFAGGVAMELSQTKHITIRVISAKGLPKVDTLGWCDPYVRVECGKEKRRTGIRKGATGSVVLFNETFEFDVPAKSARCITVMLFNFRSLQSDELLGSAEVHVSDVTTVGSPKSDAQKSEDESTLPKRRSSVVNNTPMEVPLYDMQGDRNGFLTVCVSVPADVARGTPSPLPRHVSFHSGNDDGGDGDDGLARQWL